MNGLFASTEFYSFFQMALDAALIVVVLYFIFRRPAALRGGGELVQKLEGVIEETRSIAEDFEANLRERQRVIQQLMKRLDERIQEIDRLQQRLDILKRDSEAMLQRAEQTRLDRTQYVRPSSHARPSERQKVIQLAQNGLDARDIAEQLRKPIGEVELILNLSRLSSE